MIEEDDTVLIKIIYPEAEDYPALKTNTEGPLGLSFFNSLFCWLALLAAFKYWLDHEAKNIDTSKPKPKKILVNSRMHDLNSIEVLGETLLVEGQRLSREEVILAGLVYDIDGDLYLDLSKQGYSTIETKVDYIKISKT